MATPEPGFGADEDMSTLGERLSLPPDFEHLRARVEANAPRRCPTRAGGARPRRGPRDLRPGGRPLRVACSYRRSGRSGLDLPAVSLGLWHNFGERPAVRRHSAPSPAARSTSGSRTSTSRTTTARPTARPRRSSAQILRHRPRPYRDELVISTKAGYDMWPGPYGDRRLAQVPAGLARPVARPHGPRLRRHLLLAPPRPGDAARGDHGRAATARCSRARRSTSASRPTRSERTAEAAAILRELGTPLLIHQPSYSMLNRWIEDDRLLDTLEERGRLHRVLAAGPGPAHRPLPRRHPRRLAPPPAARCAGHAHRGRLAKVRGARRDRRAARPDRWPSWRWPGRCATRG